MTKADLPEGEWYDFFTGQRYPGKQEIMIESPLEKLPVFAKGGSIIPMQSVIQSTSQKPTDTLFVHVYNGTKASEYAYYEDDGTSYDYEKGNSLKQLFRFDPIAKKLTIEAPEGPYKSKFTTISLMMHGFEAAQRFSVENKIMSTSAVHIDLLSALRPGDALYIDGKRFTQEVNQFSLPAKITLTVLSWE